MPEVIDPFMSQFKDPAKPEKMVAPLRDVPETLQKEMKKLHKDIRHHLKKFCNKVENIMSDCELKFYHNTKPELVDVLFPAIYEVITENFYSEEQVEAHKEKNNGIANHSDYGRKARLGKVS